MKIEELVDKVATECHYVNDADVRSNLLEFATRLIASYTQQQDPVAQVLTSSASGGTYSHPPFIEQLPAGTKLYASPVVPADMVLVRREPTEAMVRASWYCAGLTSPVYGQRKYIAIAWHAMIAAGEKSC